jgi:hypothetical protein
LSTIDLDQHFAERELGNQSGAEGGIRNLIVDQMQIRMSPRLHGILDETRWLRASHETTPMPTIKIITAIGS